VDVPAEALKKMGWRAFGCVLVGVVLSEVEPRLCDLVIDKQISLNEKGQYLADPRCVSSQNSLHAKFAEFLFHALR
jgi:hypothetical protein